MVKSDLSFLVSIHICELQPLKVEGYATGYSYRKRASCLGSWLGVWNRVKYQIVICPLFRLGGQQMGSCTFLLGQCCAV